jgi:hypothetical protein
MEQLADLGAALVHLTASHLPGSDGAGGTVCLGRGVGYIGLTSWK